jgi:hypothetical protein
MAKDFNWDDHIPNNDDEDNNEDDMFGVEPEPWVERQVEIEKQMLFRDLERSTPIPITPSDWNEVWTLTEEDMDDMTQCWIRHFMREGDTNRGKWNIINTYRREWLIQMQYHNELKEEFELCSLLQEVILWLDKQERAVKKSGMRLESKGWNTLR